MKSYFSYKDPIPDDLKSFLVHKFTCASVVLALLAKHVVISKLGLRNISKRITSCIFLNIYTPPQHALTRIILFLLKLIKLKKIDKANSKFDLKFKEALHIKIGLNRELRSAKKPFSSHTFTIACTTSLLLFVFVFLPFPFIYYFHYLWY